MPNEQNQPGEYDAVLGGQNLIPRYAAVLGGIAGVKSRLASPIVEVRIAALSQALKYGENGLDLIILQGLEDKSLQVKIAAYNLLKCQTEFKVKPKLNDFFYRFKFEVIRVDNQGIAKSRGVKSAHFFTEDLGDGTAIDMVYIPGGTFQMGCSHNSSAQPQHPVRIQPFFMGKYTVTQEQWKKVMENTSYFKADKRPIEQVSWNESVEFCDRLTKRTGNSYRLPSEAEWEYACRAGTITNLSFGDQITHDLVNTSFGDCEDIFIYRSIGCCDPYYWHFKDSREHTLDVGQFYPNAFGLFDMHGNVWEWCSDPYHSNYNGAPSDGSSWEIGGSENQRMLRGGSWKSDSSECSSSYRYYLSRDSRRNDIGFRVVVGLV
jgi:formylglycine-generating enzyme required for sulfatase activity